MLSGVAAAAGRLPDRDRAEQHLRRWFGLVADAEVPELHRLARTLDAWRAELLACFDTGSLTDGPTEAIKRRPDLKDQES
jgi:transposase